VKGAEPVYSLLKENEAEGFLQAQVDLRSLDARDRISGSSNARNPCERAQSIKRPALERHDSHNKRAS